MVSDRLGNGMQKKPVEMKGCTPGDRPKEHKLLSGWYGLVVSIPKSKGTLNGRQLVMSARGHPVLGRFCEGLKLHAVAPTAQMQYMQIAHADDIRNWCYSYGPKYQL